MNSTIAAPTTPTGTRPDQHILSYNPQIAETVLSGTSGAGNITSFSHCTTRLRFELVDASKVDADTLDRTDGVLGVVPQGGGRYQVVTGGAVAGVYATMQSPPGMSAGAMMTDAEVKAQARSKAHGKSAWLDAFFEYLSDSFRPILSVLLGASLITAFAVMLDALGIVDSCAADKSASWVFVDALWRAVFYFLSIMVTHNAAKKLDVDPWLGGTIMAALMAPEFMPLSNKERFPELTCTTDELLNTESCTAHIFGLPLQFNDYGGNVFVPLIMIAVLVLVYKGLKMVIPTNLQMVFVPFIAMDIMIPTTTSLIDPLGVWFGDGLGIGMAWTNSHAPFVFALIIPVMYLLLVPLGLHWPLSVLMLVNIQTLGYDSIQGPMGAWNFACFGATASMLFLSMHDKDVQMRQTVTGAFTAGLLGGISEPSLYGTHLRFKRIYPLMLIGCFAGGLTIAILGLASGGVTTSAFAFTSLLTIPVFDPMWIYTIAIAVAFFMAFTLVALFDYRAAEQKAGALASTGGASAAATAAALIEEDETLVANAESTTAAFAPVGGQILSLVDSGDKVFAPGVFGEGVAIVLNSGRIVSPVTGVLRTVAKTGHAFGIKTDDGVEVLVHVGIDTASMDGEGFEALVEKKQRAEVDDALVNVDLAKVASAGYATTTLMTVTDSKTMSAVTPIVDTVVNAGNPVTDIVR